MAMRVNRRYARERWGCSLRFRFPTVKLLCDLLECCQELIQKLLPERLSLLFVPGCGKCDIPLRSTTVNIHEAKTHLSRLLKRAHDGEEIILSKSGRPYARLMPLEPTPLRRKRAFWNGWRRGKAL